MCRGTGFNPRRCHHIEILLCQKKSEVDLSQLSWGVQSSCMDKCSSNSVFCSEKTSHVVWLVPIKKPNICMRFPWIAFTYVSLMNHFQSSWAAWDIATQKQGGRLLKLSQPAGTGCLSKCGPIPKARNLENPVWKLKIRMNVNQSGPGLCLLIDQWFKAGLVSEIAQTFILGSWLPVKSQTRHETEARDSICQLY